MLKFGDKGERFAYAESIPAPPLLKLENITFILVHERPIKT
ncbi:hypothetical protein [Paenibacillus xylanexedens]|nr:hypothetical protein [Paenibacillus xylanexedens]